MRSSSLVLRHKEPENQTPFLLQNVFLMKVRAPRKTVRIECSHWGANVSKRDYIMTTWVLRRVLRETPMLGQRKK